MNQLAQQVGSMLHGKSLQNVVGTLSTRKVGKDTHRIVTLEIDLDDHVKQPDGTQRVTAKGNVLIATTGTNPYVPAVPEFGFSLNVWKQPSA